ncbi:hypothetical protein C8Q80DRAFT_1347069 [Daedaleopsis nitida]|nr:hypothetical protein C8Q80DRAFT_1347069 [Daedaleopsis nitida]
MDQTTGRVRLYSFMQLDRLFSELEEAEMIMRRVREARAWMPKQWNRYQETKSAKDIAEKLNQAYYEFRRTNRVREQHVLSNDQVLEQLFKHTGNSRREPWMDHHANYLPGTFSDLLEKLDAWISMTAGWEGIQVVHITGGAYTGKSVIAAEVCQRLTCTVSADSSQHHPVHYLSRSSLGSTW